MNFLPARDSETLARNDGYTMHRIKSFANALRVTGIAAAAVLCVSAAHAHHGWGGYKTEVEMTLTISELKLGNPHDRLIATDADGQEWNLLLAPPARNRRFGFDENTLSVGDEVELLGARHPRRNEIKVHCIFVAGESVYTYRYNNGKSSLARRGREERC